MIAYTYNDLDGINVDLKAFSEKSYHDVCGARLEPVKRNIAYIARETDVWIKVTTLLIPGLNDGNDELRAMLAWLAGVDAEIPWHVTAFRPAYKMLDRPPTSPHALARAYEIGKEAGLHYVYVGNVALPGQQVPASGDRLRHVSGGGVLFPLARRVEERGGRSKNPGRGSGRSLSWPTCPSSPLPWASWSTRSPDW